MTGTETNAERTTPLLSSDAREQCSTIGKRALSVVSNLLAFLVDDEGTGWQVVWGLLTLVVLGSALGVALPKNPALPTPWYRYVSSAIGYTYFLCWSVSFYPQVMSNYRRRSTQGLSPDFCMLNVLGFACYMVYNLSLFYSPTIQEQYRERHSGDVTVQSNDVAFAVHAFILASITLCQIGYYDGFYHSQRPSKTILALLVTLLVVIAAFPILVGNLDSLEWLDYLYLLSYIKILISAVKYIPQLFLNIRRSSTEGWSIWNIILDFSGGILSDLQLLFDCADMGDFTGITGNLGKLGLGLISVAFDIMFMIQHYILYPSLPPTTSQEESTLGLLDVIDDVNL